MAHAATATVHYEQASPSLLAQQPLTPPDQQIKFNPIWGVVYAHLESRLKALRVWRWSWWWHWARLAEYFMPRRYHWLIVANRMNKGVPINDAIIDSTGLLAVRTCAAGMWTGLTSPSRPWFSLGIALPWVQIDAEGQAWLEDTQQRAYTILAQSNFYTQAAQMFQDVTVIGTSPMIMYEDYEDVIRCYLPCAGEYYLASGARLDIDTFNREYTYTVSQTVDWVGIDNCPTQIRQQWIQGGDSLEFEYVMCHSIEPNFAMSNRGAPSERPVTIVPGKFTYREVYWLKGTPTPEPLSVRGFNSKPFMVARWATVSNDAYGRSPCMDALGDNKQIQLETLRKAEFIEKGVRPPMGANPELKNEPASIMPAHITYMSTDNQRKGFWPLFEPNPAWLPAISADIKMVADRIEKCLFVNLFMAISQMEGVQPRNELELTKRDLERLQELGPFIELFEKEFAGPAIQRLLDIMLRRRMLKPIPKSLQGVPLKIEYISIMKLAQRSAESIAMKDTFQVAGALSSAAKAAQVPDPIRTINLDEALKHYSSLNNFPQHLFFTEEQVTEHDEQRQKAMQQAQAPQQAMAGVEAAKTLSDTQLGGGNALGAMLGAPQGAAPGEG